MALFAGVTGLLLMWIMYRSLPKPIGSKLDVFTLKTMFNYGLPLSIGNIVSGFASQFYTYVLAFYVTNNASIGNYSVALNFVVLITFFATPVTTMLFSAFSKIDFSQRQRDFAKCFSILSKVRCAHSCARYRVWLWLLHNLLSAQYLRDKYAEAPLVFGYIIDRLPLRCFR